MSVLTRLSKKYMFPLKLMRVLSMEEYSDIITWLPNGRAFVIISPSKLVSTVIPLFFKKVKYSSFLRKLARWGFQRNGSEKESGSFYHKNFQRDNEELCTKIRPGDALPLMNRAQSDKKNQETYGDCQAFQYQCKENQSDIAEVPEEVNMEGANTSRIQISSRPVDFYMARAQAQGKALHCADDLAHNKLHRNTTKRRQRQLFAELSASRLIDHNTTEATDKVKSSAYVSLVQKVMNIYLREKLLDIHYNALVLQNAFDYSTSLHLQLDYNLSMLRIMRQLNPDSTYNCPTRNSGDFSEINCKVEPNNKKEHVPIQCDRDASFVTL